MGNISGSIMSVPLATENMTLIKQSKKEAKKYEWLYHCTSVEALIGMIEDREMWLSNLQVVNDKEEVGRIDYEEYEKSYYVGCFTYDKNITEEHWREYGQSEHRVLFGVKTEWFNKKLTFLNVDHTKNNWDIFKICNSFEEAIDYQIESKQEGKIVPSPYYVMDYGFYQVIYDDNLKRNIKTKSIWKIDGMALEGAAITAGIAGIIKSTHGICIREGKEPYDKDWSSEKEVRLKVGVMTNNIDLKKSGIFFRQMAIQLSENAFSELPIAFSPDMSVKDKEYFLDKIRILLPNSNVFEM